MNMLTRLRRHMMLTCEDVNEFLVAYLEGDLSDSLRRRFEKHVARCAQCTAYLNQYRHTIELVKEAETTMEAPPDELVEMTLTFLRDHYDDTR